MLEEVSLKKRKQVEGLIENTGKADFSVVS